LSRPGWPCTIGCSVPTDGSTVADAAGETAVALARRFDAELHVLHVREPTERPVGAGDAPSTDATEHGDEATESVSEMAADAGVETRTATLEKRETIHRTILQYAEENDIDCVVMGTHGRTGLDRFVPGSVAGLTLRESSIPVMTVHEDTVVDTAFDDVPSRRTVVPVPPPRLTTRSTWRGRRARPCTSSTSSIRRRGGGANVATVLDTL